MFHKYQKMMEGMDEEEDGSRPASIPLMDSDDATADENAMPPSIPSIRLYDVDAILEISPEVATGFIILLTGGHFGGAAAAAVETRAEMTSDAESSSSSSGSSRKRGSDVRSGESTSQMEDRGELTAAMSVDTMEMAFTAVTEGNVVDAVFGVSTNGGLRQTEDSSPRAFEAARLAKEALRDAAETTHVIRKLAVESYAAGFLIVVDYHAKIRDLTLFSWCWNYQALRKQAHKDLSRAFSIIHEALAVSST